MHLEEDGLVIRGLPLGTSSWVGDSIKIYIATESVEHVHLAEDFDFADYTEVENDFLITIWNTYMNNNEKEL